MRFLFYFFGVVFFIMVVLSFTSLPFWADYYLGSTAKYIKTSPDAIVIMGGSGMPSQSGLIRCFYGAKVATEYPKAKVIIALPGDTLDNTSSVILMADELIIRGVDSSRIIYENEGTNTRWEALNIKSRFFPNTSPSVLIVTSPSHLFRSIKTFQKVGFEKVYGKATFGRSNETPLDFNAEDLGGNNEIPDVGQQISLRYKVWARMHIQIDIMREYVAIAYYWLMGWI